MNKMLKAYEEYNQDILDKIKEIVNTVNEYVETNDIDLMIDFPKSYIDYDITFTVNKDAVYAEFNHTDAYDDILDEYSELRIPFSLFEDVSKSINFYLGANEMQHSNTQKEIVQRLFSASLNLEVNHLSEQDIEKIREVKKNIDAVVYSFKTKDSDCSCR